MRWRRNPPTSVRGETTALSLQATVDWSSGDPSRTITVYALCPHSTPFARMWEDNESERVRKRERERREVAGTEPRKAEPERRGAVRVRQE